MDLFYDKSECGLGSTEELHTPDPVNCTAAGQSPQSEIVSIFDSKNTANYSLLALASLQHRFHKQHKVQCFEIVQGKK